MDNDDKVVEMNLIKSIREMPEQEFVTGSCGTCAGCGAIMGLKLAAKVLGKNTIVVNSSGCLSLVCEYPNTPMKVSWIHNAIENAAPTATGIIHVLRRKKIDANVLCYCGDGASYDIGFGSLSAAAMRRDPIIYVCYNNQAYSNTGFQWDTATPPEAATKTTPVGEKERGNNMPWKNMTKIMADHGVYAATASIAFPEDYVNKLLKAKEGKEFAYIDLLTTCPTGWELDTSQSIKYARAAVETGFWPLYEIDKTGKITINYKPHQLKPITEFTSGQRRFQHMTKQEISKLQDIINQRWVKLLGDANEH